MGRVQSDNSNIPRKKVIVRDWELGRGNCVSNSIYITIPHFQRGHNAPYLPLKILQKHCFQFLPGI